MLGAVNRIPGVLGAGGIALSMLAAAAGAASARLPRAYSGPAARIHLWIVNLLGPAVRSVERERVKWRFEPARAGDDYGGLLEPNGRIEFLAPDGAARIDPAALLAAMRSALVRRGVAVAETDGFQSYDLEIVVPPAIRAPINALQGDGRIALLWRTRCAPRRAIVAAAIALLVLLAAGFSIGGAIAGVLSAAIAAGLIAINRARRVPSIIRASAAEAAGALGIPTAKRPEDDA
jgi:hypothetical protein